MHNRIAWSYSGLIAYIDVRHKVFVTWLKFNDGNKWDYAPPVSVPLPSEGRPLHLSWSSTNYDLAIADDIGRLHIVNIGVSGTPTNQLIASAVRDQRPRPAELDRLVGLHWLDNSDFEDQKKQGWIPVSPMKPFVPIKIRSSLAAVNGNGMLRLFVQTPDFRYTEVDELIPGISSISRATFLQINADVLLVVIVTGTNSLVIYQVNITWNNQVGQTNVSSTNAINNGGVGNLQTGMAPVPAQSITPNTANPSQVTASSELIKVTINEIASTPLDGEELVALVAAKISLVNNQPKSLLIRAVYSHFCMDFVLNETAEALHHSFFELLNASDPVPPEPVKLWTFFNPPQKKDFKSDVKEYAHFEDVVIIVHRDGSVVSEGLTEPSVLQVDKVGLRFDKLCAANASSVCFSPSGCCIAYFDRMPANKGSTVKSDSSEVFNVKGVEPPMPISSENDAREIAYALSVNVSNSLNHSRSIDDLLKVCWEVLKVSPHEYKSTIFESLSKETQRLLNVTLSAPDDPNKTEQLMTNPSPFQHWLSFMSVLGTEKNFQRASGSDMCFTLLHLHQLSFSVTWTMRRITQKPRAQSIDQYRIEIQASQYHLTTMFGPVRWATDLIVRISQELYSALKSKSPMEYLMAKPNIYCVLLMSSISRYLLRYFLRAIRTLNGAAKNLTELEGRVNAKLSSVAQVSQDSNVASEARASLLSPSNYLATHAFKKLAAQIQNLPVKLDVFEKFILNIEEKYKLLIASTKMPEDLCASLESEMIYSAKVPQKFTPLVKLALDTSDKALFPLLDIPNLYFHDTTWLGLEGSCDEEIDGIRKQIILPQESTQYCSRCNIKSIYGTETGKMPSHWQYVFQRYCICGGSWQRKPSI